MMDLNGIATLLLALLWVAGVVWITRQEKAAKSSTSKQDVCSVCDLEKSFCEFLWTTVGTGTRTFESSIEALDGLMGIIQWATLHFDLTQVTTGSASTSRFKILMAFTNATED